MVGGVQTFELYTLDLQLKGGVGEEGLKKAEDSARTSKITNTDESLH